MQRHVGGVRGTVLLRGYCPVCGRGVAGGNMSRLSVQAGRRQISLRPHNRPGTGTLCPGGRSTVPADLGLTSEWATKVRQREARRAAWRRTLGRG